MKITKEVTFVLFVVIVGIVSVSISSAAASHDSSLLSESQAVIFSQDYVNQTYHIFLELNRSELASRWNNTILGKPVLQWIYMPVNDSVVPLDYAIPVYSNNNIIGLIGVDPYTGTFLWRTHIYDTNSTITDTLNQQLYPLYSSASSNENFSFAESKIVLMYKKNYLFIPSNNTNNSIIVDLSDRSQMKFTEAKKILSKEANFSGNINGGGIGEKTQYSSIQGVTEAIPYLPIKTGKTAMQGIPSSKWLGPNKVPYFYQGSCAWCGQYSLQMMSWWWGRTDITAGGISNYLGKSCSQGTNLWERDDALKNYMDFKWAWKGSMKSIANSGTSQTADDIKGDINADLPVAVCTRHDTSVTDADHVRLVVGYDTSGIYLHDPAGWWGWAYGYDAWVSNSIFESLWNVYCGGWPFSIYRGGNVGYPGDYEQETCSVQLSGLPSSVENGNVYELCISLSPEGDENFWGGAHIRLDNTEFVSVSGSGFDSYQAYDSSANPIPVSGSKIIEFYVDYTEPIVTTYYAYPKIKVTSTTGDDVTVQYRCWACDGDDKVHCGVHTTTINDDRDLAGGPSSIQMPSVMIAEF